MANQDNTKNNEDNKTISSISKSNPSGVKVVRKRSAAIDQTSGYDEEIEETKSNTRSREISAKNNKNLDQREERNIDDDRKDRRSSETRENKRTNNDIEQREINDDRKERKTDETKSKTTKMTKKKLSKKSLAIILIIIIAIIIIPFGVYRYNRYTHTPEYLKEQQDEEIEDLLAKISKVMLLPSEKPDMHNIDDPEKITAWQPFFQNTIKGDKLFIFNKSSKAILYSPERDLIVNAGSISFVEPNIPEINKAKEDEAAAQQTETVKEEDTQTTTTGE